METDEDRPGLTRVCVCTRWEVPLITTSFWPTLAPAALLGWPLEDWDQVLELLGDQPPWGPCMDQELDLSGSLSMGQDPSRATSGPHRA